MFFIAESIQSFSGIIFYAPKIGDISSIHEIKCSGKKRLQHSCYAQRWAVSRYLYRRYVSRDTFVSISVSIKCFITVSRIGID